MEMMKRISSLCVEQINCFLGDHCYPGKGSEDNVMVREGVVSYVRPAHHVLSTKSQSKPAVRM
jgi:hypothetical protein